MLLLVLLSTVAICVARPNVIDTKNVVTVPPNCPVGQQWINGQCRDVWREDVIINPVNVVTVPPNCPAGQEYINGQCRDVWRNQNDPRSDVEETYENVGPKNVVTVRPNCRPGQQWINGQCRDVWRSGVNPANVVTVPPNCPAGQEYINGVCREVWLKQEFNQLQYFLDGFGTIQQEREKRETGDEVYKDEVLSRHFYSERNVISVPNQCPNGTRPDALGVCRPIFD